MRLRGAGDPEPLEQMIERALCPEEFIRDGARYPFVTGLREVRNRVEELVATEPARAAVLCEVFLAGC